GVQISWVLTYQTATHGNQCKVTLRWRVDQPDTTPFSGHTRGSGAQLCAVPPWATVVLRPRLTTSGSPSMKETLLSTPTTTIRSAASTSTVDLRPVARACSQVPSNTTTASSAVTTSSRCAPSSCTSLPSSTTSSMSSLLVLCTGSVCSPLPSAIPPAPVASLPLSWSGPRQDDSQPTMKKVSATAPPVAVSSLTLIHSPTTYQP